MTLYKVLLPLTVHTADGAYGQGEEFDWELSPADEEENVKSGLIAIVPKKYRVTGETAFDGYEPGEEFESDMTQAREALLTAHISRVEEPKPKRKARTKKGD